MTDYLARAWKGIAFLERGNPGITDRIDVARMDVGSVRACPAAQAVSLALRGELDAVGYSDAADLLCDDCEELASMGFDLYLRELQEYRPYPGRTAEEYGKLTEAWRTALAEHRAR